MHYIKRSQKIGYEDLMRELAIIEQHMLVEDRDMAMRLMVLEAKLRERFQELEFRVIQSDPTYKSPLSDEDKLTLMDLSGLMPNELPPFPTFDGIDEPSKKKKIFETVGLAALLAVITAFGVFGLASLLHIALSFLA